VTLPEMMRFVSVLLLLLAAGCAEMIHPRLGMHLGDRVPPMILTDFQGRSVTLSKDIEGKVALLRFWSMDCALCNHGMLLSLDALYQKYKAKGFVPIAIHQGRPVEGDDRLSKFDHITYPLLVDEYGKVAGYFGVVGLPTTFILDEEGVVRERIIGEPGKDAYERLMTTLLYKEGFYDSVY
jgi:peroxiredoxin